MQNSNSYCLERIIQLFGQGKIGQEKLLEFLMREKIVLSPLLGHFGNSEKQL